MSALQAEVDEWRNRAVELAAESERRARKLAALTATNEALNTIISECAEACGAFVAPDASLDFKRLLPGEIELAIARARAMPPIVQEMGTINGFTITETKKR